MAGEKRRNVELGVGIVLAAAPFVFPGLPQVAWYLVLATGLALIAHDLTARYDLISPAHNLISRFIMSPPIDSPIRFNSRTAALLAMLFILIMVGIMAGVLGQQWLVDHPFEIYQPPEADRHGRLFISASLEPLSAAKSGRTEEQTEREISPFVGRWIAITGRINDIFDDPASKKVYMTIWSDRQNSIIVQFNRTKWLPFIQVFNRDDIVAVYCKIAGFSFSAFEYDNCGLARPPHDWR